MLAHLTIVVGDWSARLMVQTVQQMVRQKDRVQTTEPVIRRAEEVTVRYIMYVCCFIRPIYIHMLRL